MMNFYRWDYSLFAKYLRPVCHSIHKLFLDV
jgi:hypothetical protein